MKKFSLLKTMGLTVFVALLITGAVIGSKCLSHLPDPEPRYLHMNGLSLNMTLMTSSRIGHQIITEIFKIFLEEILGYRNVKTIKIGGVPSISKVFDAMFPDDRFEYPNFMVNLDVLITPDTDTGFYMSKYPMIDSGGLIPPGRYGWFIPEPLSKTIPYSDHWKFFKDPFNAQYFDVTKDEDLLLLKRNSINATSKRYFCEEKYCKEGIYIPQQCRGLTNNQSCSLMLTSYPETTNFIMEHIIELKLYMKVIWLGPNLREVVDKLTNMYVLQDSKKSIIFLEWTPGYFTLGREKITSVSLPNCDFFKSMPTIGCKYETTKNIKMAWSKLRDIGMPALQAIHKIQFNKSNYENLLRIYNAQNDKSFQSSACQWMKSNDKIWSTWLPLTAEKRDLIIGGIFPLTGAFYNGIGLVLAGRMAQDAINNNSTILPDYNILLSTNDGKCRSDMVMKTFIDYVHERVFDNTLGILGPACSETVEPLAGISQHYNILVISYSAEGSSFSDRSKYPYIFRTIGENKQYIQVYLHLFKAFEWRRVAALTEDGQKYTEYISSMGDLLQENGISLISNLKFPRERDETVMARYLQQLKDKKAKIIIADIYDEIARIVMCQAYKQKMTAKQGYVWFLPPWLSTGWYNIAHFNKYFNESVNCTNEMMIMAINGHFSLSQAYFAPDDTVMQENITVGEWRKKYEGKVAEWANNTEKVFNPYTTLNNNNFVSNYAGYVYDAVWTYALAADKLLKNNPEYITSLHSEKPTNDLVRIVEATDFYGVSGHIKFYGGPSRFSVINFVQWINGDDILIGNFFPNISITQPEVIGGTLDLNMSSIVWLNEDQSKPEDGTQEAEECILGPLAEFLNITCSDAIILVNVLGFSLLGTILIIAVIVLKRRYDQKLRLTEEYMKSMGIDKQTMMNMTNLDKWETSRECVVINRKLGEGAFGTVYGGEALLVEGKGWVPVAVKTLKVGSTTEQKLDFLSEAESMKRFDHKNIVKLLGVCTKSEPVYTIMEYMLYGDLKTYLLARRHLVNGRFREESEEVSNKKLTSMAFDVARALAYLAELKYVHRDIACRNCLVNSQRMVKLGDFGMTRLIFENDYYRFSRKGMLPVRWMAPESLGLGIFTPFSDIWSYGVLLYEIITFGSFPFQGMSNNEVLECVKNNRTLKIPPGVKPQLVGLMKSCWNKEYKTRPRATEIADFLANNPRLLSPCLDVPLSSVQLDYPGELDILPKLSNKSHHTINSSQDNQNKENDSSVINSLRFDNPNYISGDIPSNRTMPNNRNGKISFKNEFLNDNIIDEEIIPFV